MNTTYSNRIVIMFFLCMIVLGTLFLSLPWVVNQKVALIDRIFTVTSAVCVTGLTVVDISKVFNFWGQLILLLWIQVGGLGYMIFATTIIILFGKLNIVQKSVVGESLSLKEFVRISQIVPLMKMVLRLTLGFELIAAVVLFIKFMFVNKMCFTKSLWYAVFHSVSAFCNAGFTLFSNNLESFQDDVVVNVVISLLIIFGGLGFLVWMDIFRKFLNRKEKFMLHTKIVLVTTVALILTSFILIFLLNRKIFIFKEMSLKTQLLVSWFQSVTPRTAGFNTFPIKEFSTGTILIIIFLMFIGASPGGTGGGIKTTTFSVIICSILNFISGERDVVIFKRRISNNVVLKSFTVFFVGLTWVAVVSFIMSLYSSFSYKEVLFETVSAFGTVGLSLGITPYIDNFSKILLIITMLFGRVGGLTLLSLILAKEPKEIKYLEEPVSVG